MSLDTYAWWRAIHADMETFSEQVAANIRAELARQKKTQSHLIEVWGITQGSVSKRLSGATPLDVNEVQKVADWLGIPLSRLITGEAAS